MASRINNCVRRFIPRLEALSERTLPSVTFVEVDGKLVVKGDQHANNIVVTDDGSANAGNVVVVADGETYTAQGAITSIVVWGRSGTDTVEYTLTGDLSSERTLKAFLGNQHDAFTATLNARLLDGGTLAIDARGGNGQDSLTFAGVNADVAGTASLDVDLRGGNGCDSVTIDYSGFLVGVASFSGRGGNGTDVLTGSIALTTFTNGETNEEEPSPGSLSVDFRGGNGKDEITLSVTGDQGLASLNAVANGGNGKDLIVATDNVTIVD